MKNKNAFSKKGHNRVVLEWTAPEYIQHEKSTRWYLGAGVFLVIIMALAILSDNWSMALAFVVFAGVYHYLHTHHPPKEIRILISEMGVSVGEMFFPFSHIQAFWIIYEHGLRTLNLRVSNHFFSDIIVQLNEQDPVEVRHYLVSQVPEWEGKSEKLGDMVLRFLKF